MRRMLSNPAMAVSLLLVLTGTTIWVTGYYRPQRVLRLAAGAAGTPTDVLAWPGSLRVRPASFADDVLNVPTATVWPPPEWRVPQELAPRWVSYRGGGGWQLQVPYWMLTVPFCALPARRLVQIARSRRRRRRAGRCPTCGYDCRATPQKCPECGTVLRAADLHARAQG